MKINDMTPMYIHDLFSDFGHIFGINFINGDSELYDNMNYLVVHYSHDKVIYYTGLLEGRSNSTVTKSIPDKEKMIHKWIVTDSELIEY